MWSSRAGNVFSRPQRLVFSCVLLLGGGACGSSDSGEGESDEAHLPAEVWFRGHVTWGHEVRSFVQCGATEASWVIDTTGGELRRRYEELATKPYQALYFELRGTLGPGLKTGFAADYSTALTVLEILRAEKDEPGCVLAADTEAPG